MTEKMHRVGDVRSEVHKPLIVVYLQNKRKKHQRDQCEDQENNPDPRGPDPFRDPVKIENTGYQGEDDQKQEQARKAAKMCQKGEYYRTSHHNQFFGFSMIAKLP